ncbi:MAG: hypothetical protein KDJ52_15560 [Anaerolineae bacterium]|nr:hypothetical protein [Anaerolineae bacterium]
MGQIQMYVHGTREDFITCASHWISDTGWSYGIGQPRPDRENEPWSLSAVFVGKAYSLGENPPIHGDTALSAEISGGSKAFVTLMWESPKVYKLIFMIIKELHETFGIELRFCEDPYFLESLGLYDPYTKPRGGQLEQNTGNGAEQANINNVEKEPNFGKRPDVRKRRKKIWKLRQDLLDGKIEPMHLAEQFGVSLDTIDNDRKELGILFK